VLVTVSSNVSFYTGSISITVSFTRTNRTVPGGKYTVNTADSTNQFLTAISPNPENATHIEITLVSENSNLNAVFPQLIAASGDQCPYSPPSASPNYIATDLPATTNFTFTVPSRAIWYLEFVKTTEALGIVDVSFAQVNLPPQPSPGADNTGIIVGVTITILIVIAGVAIVVYKRKGAYQNIGG